MYNIDEQTIIDNPQYQKYKFDNTFAIYLELHGIETPKEMRYNRTSAMIIADNGKIPSKYWQHNPELKDDYNNTVAMYLASNGIVPPVQWEHDKNITNKYGFTVQDFLQYNNIEVPKQWQTTDYVIEDKNIIKYLINYCEKYKINKETIITNPSWQNNNYKETFAMYLAYNKIIVPKQFIHDPNIKGRYFNQTIKKCLQYNQSSIPNEQYDDEYKQNNDYKPEYLNDALNGIITDKPNNIKSKQKYESGYTVAMIYAGKGLIPSEYWYHNSNLQDNQKYTVAMILAQNGIIPPQQWHHSPYILNEDEKTVQDYLIENNIKVPEEWKIIDKQIQMTDEIQQQLNRYCKMYNIDNQQLVINYPQYQKYRIHSTFAMYLVKHKIIPPKEFQHDPTIQTFQGDTVAIILSSQGIIPPKQWMHDINMINNWGKSIKQNLYKFKYYYVNNEFIKLTEYTVQQCIQNQILDDTCQICLNEGEQYFIKSTCNHKVCLQCFREMFKVDTYETCPICRQSNWFQYQNYLNIQDEYSNTNSNSDTTTNNDTNSDTTDNESYEQSDTTTTDYNSSLQSNTTDYEYSTISQ